MKNDRTPILLRQKLKDEAAVKAPQFSPLLHARIMQQIKTRPAVQPAADSVPPSSWRTQWMIPSLATAALLLIAIAMRLRAPQTPHPAVQARVVPPNPSITQLTQELTSLREAANKPLTDANFGYLDRDAKNVLHFVINQFDIIPTAPGRRG